jgi:hypothetical protein
MKNALLKLHAAVFLWGFTGVLGRLITLNEGLLVWYRMFITVVTLYFLMQKRGELRRVSGKQNFHLFGIGGLDRYPLGLFLRQYKVFECFYSAYLSIVSRPVYLPFGADNDT